MKQIQLTQGQVALVDDEDYGRVAIYGWFAYWRKKQKTFYAARSDEGPDMHRMILGVTDRRLVVDHKDHNGLNNQRSNIRIATFSQNSANQRKTRGVSRFKGVTWHSRNKRWQAQIKKDRKMHYLGQFTDQIDAAIAYDSAARILFGEFALTNF